jgi:hypothetical protein
VTSQRPRLEVDGPIKMAETGAEVAPEAGAHEAGAEVDTESPQIQLADEQYEDEDMVKEGKVLPKGDYPDASNYGFLPYMATHSRGSVGSLLASSYAERVNSAANLILTKGNTLLGEEEINISMCKVLRMKSSFIESMRKYHPEAAHQRFMMTVISE